MTRILFTIALRNLWAHKTKSILVGSIMAFGTFLVVFGTAFLDSVSESMARSITSSLAGHLQVYSADARDELALFGSMMGGDDVGHIRDFGKLRRGIEALPNVRAVVPMGLHTSMAMSGNELDELLANLGAAVERGDDPGRDAIARQIRSITADMIEDLKNEMFIASNTQELEAERADLLKVQSDGFWEELRAEPTAALTFLETRIAPLGNDGQMLYLRNLGTDLTRFAKLFDRFRIEKGRMVPPGQRGFLFSERTYEEQVKHRVAREFDRIKDNLERGETIADNPELGGRATRLPRQYRRISYQLGPQESRALTAELRRLLDAPDGELLSLLKRFLAVDDDNFAQRHAFFYEHIAPKIELYAVALGDELTLRGVTKAGYAKSINVPVYGTYRFEGLEASDVAGAQNLVDIVTFRELYGVMSAEQQAELEAIRREAKVVDVDREGAEDALFGDDSGELLGERGEDSFEPVQLQREAATEQSFEPQAVDEGLAVSAAVILNDPAGLEAARTAIKAWAQETSAGVQVIDWQQASGIVGQFILVLRLVLYVAILIIFLVALVIINNSMVMATIERMAEIGTMRAIGAQRSVIMLTFLIETTILGAAAGVGGALLALATVGYLGAVGIPAPSDILVFLFSGPRLYPAATAMNFLTGIAAIVIVSIASTLYPARIATGVAPVSAMQSKE